MVVQRHDPGFHIGTAHRRTPSRVHRIFAWAERPDSRTYGTEFRAPRDPHVRCWGDLHHDREGFDVATVANYSPNSFLVFFKTRHSFHAVEAVVAGIPNDRYGAAAGLLRAVWWSFKISRVPTSWRTGRQRRSSGSMPSDAPCN